MATASVDQYTNELHHHDSNMQKSAQTGAKKDLSAARLFCAPLDEGYSNDHGILYMVARLIPQAAETLVAGKHLV